jgi:hypothetical protein
LLPEYYSVPYVGLKQNFRSRILAKIVAKILFPFFNNIPSKINENDETLRENFQFSAKHNTSWQIIDGIFTNKK